MDRLKIVPVSEARPNLSALIDEANEGGQPVFINSRSKVKAVILGIDEYNALVERLEDLEDSLDVLLARTRGEPSRPLQDVLSDLGVDK